MAKARPLYYSFNSGELSPLLDMRVDQAKYQSGCKVLQNMIPTPYGPAFRAPGTYYIADTKDHTKSFRLERFVFSTVQAYILEFGDQYIRFYKDGGQILDGASAYEISAPYLESDLEELQFEQSADTLYIAHNDYVRRKLTRTGHTSWTLTELTAETGPFLEQNSSDTTITPGYDAWVSQTGGGSYSADDCVSYSGSYYKNLTGNNTDTNPSADSTN